MSSIKIDIFEVGLTPMLEELKKERTRLLNQTEDIGMALANQFIETVQQEANSIEDINAKIKVSNFNYIEVNEGVIRVVNDTQDATYSEFGTGIKGSANPHPLGNQLNWEHEMNPDRDYSKGWVFPYTNTSSSGVVSSGFAHTYGLPSNPVYYRSSQMIRDRIADIARSIKDE